MYKGKGDSKECINSRGIRLLSVVFKLYGIVLIKRFRDSMDKRLARNTGAFRSVRGCTQYVYTNNSCAGKF